MALADSLPSGGASGVWVFVFVLQIRGRNISLGFSDSSVKKKNLPAMQETSVQFVGREDPLEKG